MLSHGAASTTKNVTGRSWMTTDQIATLQPKLHDYLLAFRDCLCRRATFEHLEAGILELLRVAFGRWHIEKFFERAKQETGFGDFEVRKYVGLEHFSLARSVLEPRMAMRGFGSRFLRMSSRQDHMKNALMRHWLCSTMAMFFLAEQTQRLREEKSADHPGTGSPRGPHAGEENPANVSGFMETFGTNDRLPSAA